MHPEEGGLLDFGVQLAKRAAFRWPLLRELSRPRYAYNLTPGELSWLCTAISDTKDAGGYVVEVGCARGMTAAFLLTHMKSIADARPYICIDTFNGFVKRDVEFEVSERGKRRSWYRGFSYNDPAIFDANLRRLGHSNHRTVKADAAEIDWASFALIDVMLLDVDLYLPTKLVLAASCAFWSPTARILVDDVVASKAYDGAGAAVSEFCKERPFVMTPIGEKGGVISRRA
jgi:hypothetical protein